MSLFKKLFKKPKFHIPNYDILFLPLNGMFIDKIYTYKNLAIYPLDKFKISSFKSGQYNIIFQHSFMDHPVLKEYNIVCYGKDNRSCTNEFFTIEAAGDERLLMNPVLTFKFFNPQERIKPKIAQIAHTIYAVIRWFQYKIAGVGMSFDFNFLPLRSSAFSFLDGTEHKVLMPSRFAFLSTEIKFLEDDNLLDFYDTINKSINPILNNLDTKLNQLFYFYNEIWELILKDDYNLLIVKTLGFLSTYFGIKKFSQLPYIISNLKLQGIDNYTSAQILHNFNEKRKKFLHENNFMARTHIRSYIQKCDSVFGQNLVHIKFILELFNTLIYEELSNASK